MEHFGHFGLMVNADNPISSEKTRDALGWTPQRRTLLTCLEGDDLEEVKDLAA